MAETYRRAGVDIRAGDEFVSRLREKVRSTYSSAVLSDIGSFSALYAGTFRGVRDPVLVSSVDGVGTKLKVAFLMDKHDTVGQDLVNHCVNDIAVCGAKPLFFLDYLATGKLKPHVAGQILDGMIRACRENGCALVGGETAEMPGFYRENEYDLAGAIVGVASRRDLLSGRTIREGDLLIALPSTGLHTNGYSLARSILFERYEVDDFIGELDMNLGEALLTVHRSYLGAIAAVSRARGVRAIAHITGGGIAGNTRRLVPARFTASIDWESWQRPPIFRLIQRLGRVPEQDMRRTFNLGVGLVVIASAEHGKSIERALKRQRERPFVIGKIVKRRTEHH